ncbi:MAG: signal peptide protein [Betaproteobacteria bacterium]|nr:signal peptide protein [Betaproteobacteria bacterium]
MRRLQANGFLRHIGALAVLLALLVLLAPLTSHAAAPMGFDEARHLLNRTSFAANVDDINAFAKLSRAQAVDQLLAWTGTYKVGTPPPAWINDFQSPRRLRAMSEEQRKVAQREQVQKGLELRGWWMTEMIATPSPLTEKMVLFWHNHFVSSLQKVRSPVLMYRQQLVLRKHALGYFGDLLHEVAKDPAMVVYLDNASNRKAQPNENFAREVMELFTLGEGNYTEADVKEAARAFTGWSIDPDSGDYLWRPAIHDEGVKTVLGRSGNFDGDAVLDILLAQPSTAELVVGKLWREFVSPAPEAAEVKRIARMFRDNRYNVKVALRALLTSDAFYAPQNRAALIKSPVDLVVGTARQFRVEAADALPFVLASRQLGQDLFAPPNVKGWPGGEAWINSATLLQRKQLLDRLFQPQDRRAQLMAVNAPAEMQNGGQQAGGEARERFMRSMASVRFDEARWRAQFSANEPLMTKVLLAGEPVAARPQLQGMEQLRQLVLDPSYQLK